MSRSVSASRHETELENDKNPPKSKSASGQLHLVEPHEGKRQESGASDGSIRESELKLRELAKQSSLRVKKHEEEKSERKNRDDAGLAMQRHAERVAKSDELAKQRAQARLKPIPTYEDHVRGLVEDEIEHRSDGRQVTEEELKRELYERQALTRMRSVAEQPQNILNKTESGRVRFAQSATERTEELLKQSATVPKPYDALWPIILELRNYQIELNDAMDAAREKNDFSDADSFEIMKIALAKKKVDGALLQLETIARMHGTATSNAEKAKTREAAFNRSNQDISRLMTIRAELPLLAKDEAKRMRTIGDLRAREERLHREQTEMIDTLTITEKKLPENSALFGTISYLLADTKSLIGTLEHAEEIRDKDFTIIEESEELTDKKSNSASRPAKPPPLKRPLPRRRTEEMQRLITDPNAMALMAAEGLPDSIMSQARPLPEPARANTAPPPPARASSTPDTTAPSHTGSDDHSASLNTASPEAQKPPFAPELKIIKQEDPAAAQPELERQWEIQKAKTLQKTTERARSLDTTPLALRETKEKARLAMELIQGVKKDLAEPVTMDTRERFDDTLLSLSKIYATLEDRLAELRLKTPSADEESQKKREQREIDEEMALISRTTMEIQDARHAIHAAFARIVWRHPAERVKPTLAAREEFIRAADREKKKKINSVLERMSALLLRQGEKNPEGYLRRGKAIFGRKTVVRQEDLAAFRRELQKIETEYLHTLYGTSELAPLQRDEQSESRLLRLSDSADIFMLWRTAKNEISNERPDPILTRTADAIQSSAERVIYGKPQAQTERPDSWLTRAADAIQNSIFGNPKTRKNHEVPVASPKEIQATLISQAKGAGITNAQDIYERILSAASRNADAGMLNIPQYLSSMTDLRRVISIGASPQTIRRYLENFKKIHSEFAAHRSAQPEGNQLIELAERAIMEKSDQAQAA